MESDAEFSRGTDKRIEYDMIAKDRTPAHGARRGGPSAKSQRSELPHALTIMQAPRFSRLEGLFISRSRRAINLAFKVFPGAPYKFAVVFSSRSEE